MNDDKSFLVAKTAMGSTFDIVQSEDEPPVFFCCHGIHTLDSRPSMTLAEAIVNCCKFVESFNERKPSMDNPFGEAKLVPGFCRKCGCTDEDCTECIAETGGACHWIAPNLCSRCDPDAGELSKRVKAALQICQDATHDNTRENVMLQDVSDPARRAIHQVIRSMQDGLCPRCGNSNVRNDYGAPMRCRECDFEISHDEKRRGQQLFLPILNEAIEHFEYVFGKRPESAIVEAEFEVVDEENESGVEFDYRLAVKQGFAMTVSGLAVNKISYYNGKLAGEIERDNGALEDLTWNLNGKSVCGDRTIQLVNHTPKVALPAEPESNADTSAGFNLQHALAAGAQTKHGLRVENITWSPSEFEPQYPLLGNIVMRSGVVAKNRRWSTEGKSNRGHMFNLSSVEPKFVAEYPLSSPDIDLNSVCRLIELLRERCVELGDNPASDVQILAQECCKQLLTFNNSNER